MRQNTCGTESRMPEASSFKWAVRPTNSSWDGSRERALTQPNSQTEKEDTAADHQDEWSSIKKIQTTLNLLKEIKAPI